MAPRSCQIPSTRVVGGIWRPTIVILEARSGRLSVDLRQQRLPRPRRFAYHPSHGNLATLWAGSGPT